MRTRQSIAENRVRAKKKGEIAAALLDLRLYVDNINKAPKLALRNGIYQDSSKVMREGSSVTVNNVTFHYRLEDKGLYMQRYGSIRVKDYRIKDLPEEFVQDMLDIAVLGFFDPHQGPEELFASDPYTMTVTQKFMPLLITKSGDNKAGVKETIDANVRF